MRPRKRLFLISISGLIALYTATFIGNALSGGYLLMPSGNFRPLVGLAQPDTWVWQPKYGIFHLYRNALGERDVIADGIGRFYAPLILLTQSLLKPSKPCDQGDNPPYAPPVDQLHPIYQEMIKERERSRQSLP